MGLVTKGINLGLAGVVTLATIALAFRGCCPRNSREFAEMLRDAVKTLDPHEKTYFVSRSLAKVGYLERTDDSTVHEDIKKTPPEAVAEEQQAVAQSPQAVVARPQPGQKVNAKA